jgi:hypothetical protein
MAGSARQAWAHEQWRRQKHELHAEERKGEAGEDEGDDSLDHGLLLATLARGGRRRAAMTSDSLSEPVNTRGTRIVL